MMLSNEHSLRAPSIRLRQLAKRLRVLMFVICVLVIEWFSRQTAGSAAQAMILGLWTAANTFAWGWESWYLFRRSSARLVPSESAVQTHYKTWVWILSSVVAANALVMWSVGNSVWIHQSQ